MNSRSHFQSSGLTLREVLVVLGISLLLLALLFPAIRLSGDAARRAQCASHLRQIGVALASYHKTNRQLPSAMTGSRTGPAPFHGNAGRLSGIVSLLPYLDHPQLWQNISESTEFAGVVYPAMGPPPWIEEYPPWRQQVDVFRCPTAPQTEATFGRINYAFCIGDVTERIHDPMFLRGAFGCQLNSRYQNIADGLSYTVGIGEIGTAAGAAVPGQFAVNQAIEMLADPSLCFGVVESAAIQQYQNGVSLSRLGRGGRWADGAAGFGLFATLLPPNSPSCAVGGVEAVDGIYSAGSYHTGGGNFLLLDGAVTFLANDIDAGDPNRTPPNAELQDGEAVPSPYGVWGALGTAAGEEPIKELF